jgi:hypothetical protein
MAQIAAHETWRLEQFGLAFMQAVASVAACSVTRPAVDDDSIDLTFAQKTAGGRLRSPRLEAQLKTTTADIVANHHLAFPLSIKNYDELRAPNVAVPRILIVVLVPPDCADWTLHSEEELALRKCGYWLSLRGEPAVANQVSKTVHIPRAQIFEAAALAGMLARISDGGYP